MATPNNVKTLVIPRYDEQVVPVHLGDIHIPANSTLLVENQSDRHLTIEICVEKPHPLQTQTLVIKSD